MSFFIKNGRHFFTKCLPTGLYRLDSLQDKLDDLFLDTGHAGLRLDAVVHGLKAVTAGDGIHQAGVATGLGELVKQLFRVAGQHVIVAGACNQLPYYFGGLSGTKWNGYFYMSYPNYHVITCECRTGYFQPGKTYLYGLDCTGFTRHVFKACGREPHPPLSEILNNWDQRQYHLFDNREGFEAPPYQELKNSLQEGDLLVVKHENSESRHVMMYIGTLRDYGYNTTDESELAKWLDYPLVIHCGLSPFFGERFQQIIDENPDLYEGCTTTDGGVAVSIVGVNPEDAPVHEHVQNTDYDWFVMNDGGYVLSVVNLSDVKYYAWYRSER